MPDPAKPTEIEDVLASVRRIVAQGTQSKQDKLKQDSPVATGPLVLTSEQRVSSDNENADTALPLGQYTANPDKSDEPNQTLASATEHKPQKNPVNNSDPTGEAAAAQGADQSKGVTPDASESSTASPEPAHEGKQAVAPVAQGHTASSDTIIERGALVAASEPGLPAEIDPEVLRDLVSDIVRQELQGVLGERITRNVRKLVRREINRALAAQDLD